MKWQWKMEAMTSCLFLARHWQWWAGCGHLTPARPCVGSTEDQADMLGGHSAGRAGRSAACIGLKYQQECSWVDLERASYQGEPHLRPEGSALRLRIFCLWTGLQGHPMTLPSLSPRVHHTSTISAHLATPSVSPTRERAVAEPTGENLRALAAPWVCVSSGCVYSLPTPGPLSCTFILSTGPHHLCARQILLARKWNQHKKYLIRYLDYSELMNKMDPITELLAQHGFSAGSYDLANKSPEALGLISLFGQQGRIFAPAPLGFSLALSSRSHFGCYISSHHILPTRSKENGDD